MNIFSDLTTFYFCALVFDKAIPMFDNSFVFFRSKYTSHTTRGDGRRSNNFPFSRSISVKGGPKRRFQQKQNLLYVCLPKASSVCDDESVVTPMQFFFLHRHGPSVAHSFNNTRQNSILSECKNAFTLQLKY
jgi:hypothetical protein